MNRGAPGDHGAMGRDDVTQALIVLDLIDEFEHADGDRLLSSLRERAGALRAALEHARRSGTDVVYVNDAAGRWDGDAPGHVHDALAAAGGDVLRALVPRPGDLFVFKAAYSAFDGTPLARILDERRVERIVVVGAATEMCVAQTAIQAREHGLQVTVLRDACASVHPGNERIALAYLENVTGTFVLDAESWIEDAHVGARSGAP
jgi:nicotinamidase-related amidase